MQDNGGEGRGARLRFGSFSSWQRTIIICVVAICAAIAIPTAALAAAGAFSNNSATAPAVKGTNSNANGVGVQGTGKKYGVYSNGPLGVAAGKALSCTGCVGGSSTQLLHGQSETGMFSMDSSGAYLGEGITFNRPLASALPDYINGPSHIITSYPGQHVTHCPGTGLADAGYLCLYLVGSNNVTATNGYGYSSYLGPDGRFGADIYFPNDAPGSDAYVFGEYTVSAP